MASPSTLLVAHSTPVSNFGIDQKKPPKATASKLPPTEEEPPAPSYAHAQRPHTERGEDAQYNSATARNDGRSSHAGSDISLDSQGTISSMIAGRRSSMSETSFVAPRDRLTKDQVNWKGHKHVRYCTSSDGSLPESTESKGYFTAFSHGPPNGSPVDGYSDVANYPAIIDTTSSKGFSEQWEDPESARHQKVLNGRKELSMRRKAVVLASSVICLFSFITMVAILQVASSQRHKKMASAGFTGGISAIFLCIGAGFWAGDRTMVEGLIAMNIVLVCGLFLNSQIFILIS